MSNDNNKEEKELKIIVLGECGVGKTNIITRYFKDKFNEDSITTTCTSYIMKIIKRDKATYRLNIWDTAGQEKFRCITRNFLQDANIVLLVYSIIDKKSFENLEYWYKTVMDICDSNVAIAIIGNKSDLFMEQEVTEVEGKQFADEKGAIFRLVSAKNDKQGIVNLFDEALDKYIEKNKNNSNRKRKNNIKIIIDKNDKKNKKKKNKKC